MWAAGIMHLMHNWHLKDTERWGSGHDKQTVLHIVNHCSMFAFTGGISEIHSASREYVTCNHAALSTRKKKIITVSTKHVELFAGSLSAILEVV